MRKLKTFVAVLILVFVVGLAAPQASFADGGETQGPSITGTAESSGITDTPPGEVNSPPGDTQGPGFATWAKIFFLIFG